MPKQIAISKFKAHCLEVIESLQGSKKSIIITKRDKPVATIKPFTQSKNKSLFGMFEDKAEITSDIISHIDEEWDCE